MVLWYASVNPLAACVATICQRLADVLRRRYGRVVTLCDAHKHSYDRRRGLGHGEWVLRRVCQAMVNEYFIAYVAPSAIAS